MNRLSVHARIRFAGMAAIFAATIVLTCEPLRAQTTQQRVYASQSQSTTNSFVSAYDKDSQTASLSTIAGSPFSERFEGGYVAIDGQGKFLFVLNPQSNTISMFQIDQSTGALTEVPNSPFATGATINPGNAPSDPISIVAEASGKYLYVGYANGNVMPDAAITPFAIDSADLEIVLTPQLSFDIPGMPIQMFADPKGLRLYVGLGANPAAGYTGADTTVYTIDSTSGALYLDGDAGGGADEGRCIAMDPQGRFFYEGSGQFSGFIEGGMLSPVDGTGANNVTVNLGQSNIPTAMLIESSGKYLYVQENSGLFVYSIDPTTGGLTQELGPLVNATLNRGTSAADPIGSFLYSLDQQGIHVYSIDVSSGNLTEIAGSPFSITPGSALGGAGLAVTGNPVQAVTGPEAQLFPTSQDMGQVTVGQTSATRVISLVNTGGQALAITGISMTGTNAGDISQTNTCAASLAPDGNCSISLGFTPSAAGPEQATLQVADNAPGSPQSATITGTGVQARGAVTLVPGSLDFGTIAQGAQPSSQSVTLTNSGTAALTVSSVLLGGANPGDFSMTNNCTSAPVQMQESCSINVTFSPQAQGQRTATITLTDDAANSPQTINVTGNVASPFQLSAGSSGNTSATISAGQTAQYALQITPGPGFTGNISVTCSGAPVGAACTITPGTITVTNSNAVPISVSVTTSGSATALPAPGGDRPPVLFEVQGAVEVVLLAFGLFWIWRLGRIQRRRAPIGHVALQLSAVAAFSCLLMGIFGCGGGSTTAQVTPAPPPTNPQPVVTPPGSTSLTVTASSGNLPPQTIILTLTVQ